MLIFYSSSSFDYEQARPQASLVLELRVKPGSYNVQGETVGATGRGVVLDPNIANDKLEWSTESVGVVYIKALLVQVSQTPDGSSTVRQC